MGNIKNEIEEVKKELNSYRQDVKLLSEKEDELEELVTKATKVTTDLSLTKTNSTNGKNDKIAEFAAKIVDLKNEKYNCIIEMYKHKEYIEKKIDEVDQPFKNILYYKYIKGYGLTRIADMLAYNYEHTCRLHGHALEKYKDVN